MYSVQNQIDSIPAHQLKTGQTFVKVINGNPCHKIYRFMGLLGGMVKCTSIEDNSPRLINQFYLVKVLSTPKPKKVPVTSIEVGQLFALSESDLKQGYIHRMVEVQSYLCKTIYLPLSHNTHVSSFNYVIPVTHA